LTRTDFESIAKSQSREGFIRVRFISVETTVPKVRKTAKIPPTNLRDVLFPQLAALPFIIRRMSFYTRSGDDGTTGLLGEGRVYKHHPRIEALGALDEASAALGLARASCLAQQTPPILRQVQKDLYKLMAEVAATPGNAETFRGIEAAHVDWLEAQTDAISQVVTLPRQFILPGDTPSGAALSLARTIVRRAERRISELFDLGELSNPELLRYLNRLSSLCFVLEILENQAAGQSTSLAKE